MAECEHCGEEVEDPHECVDCGGQFCRDHEKPSLHDCPGSGGDQEVGPDLVADDEADADGSDLVADEDDDETDLLADEGETDEGETDGVGPDLIPDDEADADDSDLVADETPDECAHCHTAVTDPEECVGCGEYHCSDHEHPPDHDCSALADSVTEDAPALDSTPEFVDEDDDDLVPGTLLTQVAVAALVLLVVVGFGTGLVGPSLFGGGGGGGGDGGAGAGGPGANVTTAANPEPFGVEKYRVSLFERINELRQERGTGVLGEDEIRQKVLEAIARDMSRHNYSPKNESATGKRGRFNVSYRLEKRGVGCPGEGKGVLYSTAYNRPIGTRSGPEVYTNVSQVVDATVAGLRKRPEFSKMLRNENLSVQGIGVHLADDNELNVVYFACNPGSGGRLSDPAGARPTG